MASILVLMLIAAVVAMLWHLGYQERQRVTASPYIGCGKDGRPLLAGSGSYYGVSDGGGYSWHHGGGHGGDCGGGGH